MSSYALIFFTLMLALVNTGCSNDIPTVTSAPPYMAAAPTPTPNLPLVAPSSHALVFWAQQQQHITRAQQYAKELLISVEALLQNPSATNLQQSQAQWQALALTLDATIIIQELSAQIPFPASKKMQKVYKNLGLGQAHLGYLDDDGQHGKTGLIYDLDVPINATTLKQQQQLTGLNDLTLGVSPLGAILMGINGQRSSDDFLARPELNNEDRVKGFGHVNELVENRRRQLILTQSQTLLETLERLETLWNDRAHNSFINAVSQLSDAAQTVAYLQATLTLTQQQLEQLTHDEHSIGETAEQINTAQQIDYRRMRTQQQGMSDWAAASQYSELKSQRERIQTLLQELIDAPLQTTQAIDNKVEVALTKTNTVAKTATNEATIALEKTQSMEPKSAKNTATIALQKALQDMIKELTKNLDLPPQMKLNDPIDDGSRPSRTATNTL